MNDERIEKMRKCCHLLPPPGDDVVRGLLDSLAEMKSDAYKQGYHNAKIAAISAVRNHGYRRFNPRVAETECAVSRIDAALQEDRDD